MQGRAGELRSRPGAAPASRAIGTRVHVAALAVTLATACTPPIGVKRVGAPVVHRSLTASVLSTGHASEWTRNTVNSLGLLGRFEGDPEGALRALHDLITTGQGGNAELFALGELSFLRAQETGAKSHYLAAAVYAYAFLFPKNAADRPDELDPRTRLAADLYNRAITTAFRSADGRTVALAAGTYALPFGEVEVWMDPGSTYWGDRRLVEFVPVAELEVRGLRNRYRLGGLGAPLAARAVPREDVDVAESLIAPRALVAATALLRLYDVNDGMASGRLTGSLELYTADGAERTTVDGRDVPLEIEQSATIAAQLADSPMWKREIWGFLGRGDTRDRLPILVSVTPYQRGRIPVVFVHGTASSPGRWADMANDLLADPWIRKHWQLWFFMYDTGNPIAYSALLLRDKLADAVARLDPDGEDPCLRQMVVLGHSQGGLLAKMTAIDTGPGLWDAVSRVPFADVRASEPFRSLLERAMFVTPVPTVRRLIFVATPHRGSFRTGGWVNGLLRRLMRLPGNLVEMSGDLLAQEGVFYAARTTARLPTAVENMTPDNPFLKGLSTIPIADGVPYHSIIAVQGTGLTELGDDGIVRYESAHLDGAASELVVRSSHSTQSEPATIQEVRRILHLHGAGLEAAGLRCVPAAR
jgi:pimeloyl-ACP methyl ester carboxylesterase